MTTTDKDLAWLREILEAQIALVAKEQEHMRESQEAYAALMVERLQAVRREEDLYRKGTADHMDGLNHEALRLKTFVEKTVTQDTYLGDQKYAMEVLRGMEEKFTTLREQVITESAAKLATSRTQAAVVAFVVSMVSIAISWILRGGVP